MMESCESVAERVALGEPLGDLAAHVEGCARCQRVVAMPGALGASHHAVDPGLGFSARMTVGAQHRLGVRRRRRVAAGVAASLAAGAFGVFVFTRSPAPTEKLETPPVAADLPTPPEPPTIEPTHDDDLETLLRFADVDRSRRLSARWKRTTKPLAPYKKLLRGVTP